jgi:hypothetical protein
MRSRMQVMNGTAFKDISNVRFNYLIARWPVTKTQSGAYRWLCECLRCGGLTIVSGVDLRMGRTKSCGCIVPDTSAESMA